VTKQTKNKKQNKTLRKSTLKEQGFISVHGFRGFSAQLLGPIAFGPVARQNIMAGTLGRGGRKQKKRGRSWCPNIIAKDRSPLARLLSTRSPPKVPPPPSCTISWRPSLHHGGHLRSKA
jgi:hypothetical protein